MELAVNHNAESKKTKNDSGSDEPVAQAHARQSLRAGVILRYGLENNAPPKVSIDLDVPLIPTSIDRVAPAFFFEQLKNRAEQVMTISAILAPKNPASQAAARLCGGGQNVVCADDTARCAFKMEPREIARKSAHERLEKSQTHHEQTRGDGVKLWFDARADHVGKRDGQCAAKHQIMHDAQRRQKNSKAKKEKRQREPLDAAQISGQIRLRRGIHRLEKSFAENAMINDGAIDEPTESWRTVNLTAPFRSSGRAEENQVFEFMKRSATTVTLLLFQKRAESEAAMMPNNRGRIESDNATGLLQTPTKIDIVAGLMVFGIKTADLFEGPAVKRHVTAGNVFGHRIGEQNVTRSPGGSGHTRLNRILRWRTHVRSAYARAGVAGVTQTEIALVNVTDVRKLSDDLRGIVG